MLNENTKFERFADMVNKNAAAECRIIEKQTEQYKKAELSKLQKQNDEETRNLLLYETGKINSQFNKKISDIKKESRKVLAAEREKITAEVFDSVKEKLFDFVCTKEYEEFLKKSIELIILSLNPSENEKAILCCKEADLDLVKALTKDNEKVKEVVIGNVEIGGIIGSNESETLKCDDTLETRLYNQKEWFQQNSKLKISE